ncbi:MAG: sensor histidine kinase [Flavobacteriaceae bacterium]|nr:sensor histidine kinase [Flavobacteriaceae bacterium]
MKFIQLHKQALKTSALIILLIIVLSFLAFLLFDIYFDFIKVSVFLFIIFISIYFIFKISVRQFIYKQLKSVYKSTLFEDEPSLNKDNLETDFEIFLERIKEFALTKHQEIEKLHNIDDFRREFLGNVSHELKTPIFTAQGYILTLLDDDFDDKILRKKYLERANKSIDRLNYIVKDLDMISNLESGMELNFESFNIIKIITEIFELLEIKAAKKNITLSFDKIYDHPILVEADKERIEQVLTNLISNSIKYGNNDGQTTISVKLKTPNSFVINVSDNGIGINKIDIPRLFERFYRVDQSRSREQGGSGLGLAIVKHIIEAHHQQVFVKSKFNIGSTFSFTLDKVL